METTPVLLARNVLSSVLALAFPDDLVTDATAQQDFLSQVQQIKTIFDQQNVFALVTDGKALGKLQSVLVQLMDQPPTQGADALRVKAAAYDLLLVMLQQFPLTVIESYVTTAYVERIFKTLKFDQTKSDDVHERKLVAIAACKVTRELVRHVELYTPEARRALFDSFPKLFPALLALLNGVAKGDWSHESDYELWSNGIAVFMQLLEVSPNALRSFSAKIEALCIQVFQLPVAARDPSVAVYHENAIKCLGLLANASEKPHSSWKQMMDRAIEMMHVQVDGLVGKRQNSQTQQPTGIKHWTKEASSDTSTVYQRSATIIYRLKVTASIVAQCLANRSISEREVQLVLGDVIVLTRRTVAIRAQDVGKQSAVSEDGVRLPSSVVYGMLPDVQTYVLQAFSATIDRAGICALRQASKIISVIHLACETSCEASQGALYRSINTCVRTLGASAVEKLGNPLVQDIVARCKRSLDDTKALQESETKQAPQPAAVSEKKSQKGKKRKRQTVDVSKLLDAAQHVPFVSAHTQAVRARNVEAALLAIATCVNVYGSVLPIATRSLASEVCLLARKHQQKQAGAVAVNSEAISMLLLSDAMSADASGAHGANLVQAMQFWNSAAAQSHQQTSMLMQLIALNAGETLLHPRGPPLAVPLEQEATAVQKQRLRKELSSSVRGAMDWDNEDNEEESDAEDETKTTEAVEEEQEKDETVVKRVKTKEDEEMPDAEEDAEVAEEEQEEDEEEEEADEEDFDDKRPQVASTATKLQAAQINDDGDDSDDDEFPDIVDEDADDE